MGYNKADGALAWAVVAKKCMSMRARQLKGPRPAHEQALVHFPRIDEATC